MFRMVAGWSQTTNKTDDSKKASRILTDAWLLVSLRNIPGFYFNRYGYSGFVRPWQHARGYDTISSFNIKTLVFAI